MSLGLCKGEMLIIFTLLFSTFYLFSLAICSIFKYVAQIGTKYLICLCEYLPAFVYLHLKHLQTIQHTTFPRQQKQFSQQGDETTSLQSQALFLRGSALFLCPKSCDALRTSTSRHSPSPSGKITAKYTEQEH